MVSEGKGIEKTRFIIFLEEIKIESIKTLGFRTMMWGIWLNAL